MSLVIDKFYLKDKSLLSKSRELCKYMLLWTFTFKIKSNKNLDICKRDLRLCMHVFVSAPLKILLGILDNLSLSLSLSLSISLYLSIYLSLSLSLSISLSLSLLSIYLSLSLAPFSLPDVVPRDKALLDSFTYFLSTFYVGRRRNGGFSSRILSY